MIARFLGVHGEHPITRVAGMQPERARAFRSGWMSGHPRVDLVTEVDLDTYCAAGNIDDVRGYLAAQSAAGLDVAVLRDVGTPDAAHQPRRCLRSAPTETRDQQRFDVARRMPGP
jgi:5,10-methylenetetrahydromethanopterin reductase